MTNRRILLIYSYTGNCWYWECTGHGYTSREFDTEAEALRLPYDSRLWCVGCSERWEINENQPKPLKGDT